MPHVQSVAEACEFHGVNPETAIPDLSGFPEHLRSRATAALNLILVNAAINENKPFDWNSSDKKRFAWWDLEEWDSNPGGFRFCDSHCDDERSTVGSGFSFHDENGLQHSVETFEEDWKAFIK